LVYKNTYGLPLEQYQTAPNSFGFTAEQTDPNGLLYLRARYYNLQSGTFLTPDPFAGMMNRAMSRNGYSYVEGNRVHYRDPSGAFAFLSLLFAFAAGAFTSGLTYDSVQRLSNKNAKWAQGYYGGALTDALGKVLSGEVP
jgi:RHS repeat-associated protein